MECQYKLMQSLWLSAKQNRFRWVSCQLDHLCDLPNDALRRKALTQLPLTLHETYERVLMRVKEPAIPLVRRTLQWIAYATPKLTIEELTEIVSIDQDDELLDPEACPDPEDLLRFCGSLVRRARGSLELAHFTVQEFLEAIKPNDERLSEFRLDAADKLTLAKICVTYLCLPSFDQPPLILFNNGFKDIAFYNYASRHLLEYVELFWDDEDLHERLQKLFKPPKSYNLTHFVLQHLHLRICRGTVCPPGADHEWIKAICSYGFKSTHAAAMLHLGKICQWLIDQGCDVNQKSELGVPLECAIYGIECAFPPNAYAFTTLEHLFDRNAQDTIASLIDSGVDCDPEVVHDNSLSHALLKGPTDASSPFMRMLEHGMPLQSDAVTLLLRYQRRNLKQFLPNLDQIANAKMSSEVRMQLLNIAQAADVSISINVPLAETLNDDMFIEAVTYTVRFGPVSALASLASDSRFFVDMRLPGGSGTLLHLAAKHESLGPMELLLDLGFDPAKLDDTGGTVLHEATYSGMTDDDMLRRLVGANIAGIANNSDNTVWHVAAGLGHLQVLEILIAHHGSGSPRLHEVCKEGYTPLLLAVIKRQKECASLLLRSLPSTQTPSDDWRVLHFTVANGFDCLLRELLDRGADPCMVSAQNHNALHFLTKVTTYEMLDLLLNRGLNPDHRDNLGRPPLLAFLARDQRMAELKLVELETWKVEELDSSIISRLVTPFSATCQDNDGKTAWFYFCTKTVPFIFSSRLQSRHEYALHILSVLVQHGALNAHKETAHTSGMGLLVATCLQHTHNRSPKSKTIGEFLLQALCKVTKSELIVTHPQIVRLLIWSLVNWERALFEKLLELGVDVHATSESYGGSSTVDLSIEAEVDFDMLGSLLARVQPERIASTDTKWGLRHFILCRRAPGPKRNTSKLGLLLKAGLNPNARSKSLITAAHVAAGAGNVETLQLLVSYHADLSLVDKDGQTVIHHAVGGGHIAVLKYLRQVIHGGEQWARVASLSVPLVGGLQRIPAGPLRATKYFGCTLVHLAAYRLNSDVLQFLKDADLLGNINAQSREGVTPLHLAVCVQSLQPAPATTKWLLDNGADVMSRCGAKESTALHIALRLGKLEVALALVKAGACFSEDSAGLTPEMQVHPNIRADLIDRLPHTGVSIPASVMEVLKRYHKLQSTGGLYKAIMNADLKTCRFIIQRAPALSKSFKDCGACTPLIVALAWQKVDVAKLLLQHGAFTDGTPCPRIRSKGPHHDSAINIAIVQPIFNGILEQLLERSLTQGAHWTQSGAIGQPLHLAATYNPGAIRIFANHILKHERLFRYVAATLMPIQKKSNVAL